MLVSKLISKKNKDQNPKESFPTPPVPSSTASSASSPSPSPSTSTMVSDTVPDVHPALVEYLSLFPPAQYPQDFQQQGNENVYQPQMLQQSAAIPYGYDQSFFDEAMSLPLPDRASYFVDPDTPPKDLSELGMMMSGDSGIDTEWRGFIQKSFSGLLDENMSSGTGF